MFLNDVTRTHNRCADCTYATKYCHSLKLHLSKYNHKPAMVLNSDGSLPTADGLAGDFDIISKRGPPRGPRTSKRDSSSPTGYVSCCDVSPPLPTGYLRYGDVYRHPHRIGVML